MRQTLANGGNGSISGSVHSAPSGGNRSRPAKHKHNWDRRGSNVASTLGSTPRRNGGGSLVHQSDTQFVGFSPDKSSFMSYCYKSPSTSSIDSSFSSSSLGDGQMIKKPYRMSSNINFDDHQKVTSSKRAKKSPITPANSYERLFGASEPRSCRPVQLTLFNNQTQQKQFSTKQKCQKPGHQLPVSPITGHVIGNQNLTFVQSPTRSIRSPTGSCHSPLW